MSARGARAHSKLGVSERVCGSLNYKHRYRLETDNGSDLGRQAERYR
jgi:hypothetical protein